MPVRCHTASSAHHPHHPHHPAIPQDDSIASQNEERGRTIRDRCVLAKAKHAMGPSRQAWLVAPWLVVWGCLFKEPPSVGSEPLRYRKLRLSGTVKKHL